MKRGRDEQFRVVTFNLRTGVAFERSPRHLWPVRRRAAWAALADLAPDILALQEVHGFQRRGLLRGATGYLAASARPRGRWMGEACPILVRSARFAVVSEEVRWFTDDGLRADAAGTCMVGAGHPRVLSSARLLDRRSGRQLLVMNTHLATEREPRAVALAQLGAASTQDLPTILLGDFNARVDAVEVLPVHAAGLAPVSVRGATFHRFDGTIDGEPIDHLFVGTGFEVVGAFVDHNRPDGVFASDHWPVVADVRIIDAG